jgi:maltokinase
VSTNIDHNARWFAGKGRAIARTRAVATLAEGALTIAEVEYADAGGAPVERYLLVDDDVSWGDVIDNAGGALELRVTDPEVVAARGARRIPSTDQSNTLVTLGDRVLIKAYRKLEAGVHPEVELGAALAGAGAPVPRHGGSLHWIAEDGTETAIALIQEFVGGAVSGWEAPIEAAAATSSPDVAPYAAAGAAAATLHAALAARLGALPDAGAPARWLGDARAVLERAAALDPVVASARAALDARLAPLGDVQAPRVSRIHGDLHFAQFLRTPARTLIIDLEGDPTAPLAARRRPDTPLRDLAALLRSIDHIGSAAARRAAGRDTTPFIAAARAAALDAYNNPIDPIMLDALEVLGELRELVYAHRVLPEWLYAPRAGLRRLLDERAS